MNKEQKKSKNTSHKQKTKTKQTTITTENPQNKNSPKKLCWKVGYQKRDNEDIL